MNLSHAKSRLCFTLLLCTAGILCAQDRGTISGVITDFSGSAVPGATVTAKSAGTGLTQASTSGNDGGYTLLYLPAGLYTITSEKAGFRLAEVSDVRVSVTTTTRVDVRLEVGEVRQVIKVESTATLLQTDRTDLGKVYDTKTILDLPLSLSGGMRNNLQFVMLTPGVTADPGSTMSLRVGGGLVAALSMLLDGAESMSERRNDTNFQAIGTDAIAEFKVQTASYSAEYGRTGNGVVNFTSKSGTNELHGGVFEFFRNDKLNARGFFPKTRAIVRQNIFGGTVGGPVYIPKVFDGRNKAFFFFSYERSVFRSGSAPALTSTPPDALKNGDFRTWVNGAGAMIPIYDPATTRIVGSAVVRDPFPGNQIPAGRISPVAQKINSFLPSPTGPGLYNNILSVARNGTDQQIPSIKGDYIFSDKNRISGFFSRFSTGSPDPIGPLPGVTTGGFKGEGNKQYYRFNHDYIFSPRLLNHVTFGWNKQAITEIPPQYLSAADRQAIRLKGVTGDNFSDSVYGIGDGYPSLFSNVHTFSPSRTASLNEQVAWIKGTHSLKFGFILMRDYYQRNDCLECNGSVAFNPIVTGLPGSPTQTGSSYAAFLLGLPFSGQYSFGGNFRYDTPYHAWFVQDDIKVNSRLTLNIGLRYEIPTPQSEHESRQSNLCLTCPNPAAGNILGALLFAGDGPGRTGQKRFTETRLNAWGPRLGIAYQVTPKTVMRAGSAIYYIPMRTGGNADRRTAGFGGLTTAPSVTGYSEPFTLSQGFPPAQKPPLIDPGLNLFGTVPYQPSYVERAPYMYDWNFTLERSVGKSILIRTSYQATLGIKLLDSRENINQVNPKYLALGQLLFSPVGSQAAADAGIGLPWSTFPTNRPVNQALRPLPQYTGIDRRTDADNSGHSTYHAFSAGIEHHYDQGLWFQASYTFSKLISNAQSDHGGGGVFNGNGDVSTQNGYDLRADKALSNQDAPHNLVLAYVYELPVGKGKKLMSSASALEEGVLGGW
ncbi:MAG: TonB-dependent receptor, partial [Bryobacteraceae bacterium]